MKCKRQMILYVYFQDDRDIFIINIFNEMYRYLGQISVRLA